MIIGGTATAPVIVPGEVYFDAKGKHHVMGFDFDAYVDAIETGLSDTEGSN
jgi:hypothetical protein